MKADSICLKNVGRHDAKGAPMKQLRLSSLMLLCLMACPSGLSKAQAAEKVSEAIQLAEAPVVQEGWSWTYRAVEKYYAGISSSNILTGKYEINYYKGRVRFLREDGKAMLGVSNPRELQLMVPLGHVIKAKAQFFQFPLQAGNTWQGNLAGGKIPTADNTVVGVETVTTPAGSFPAFRIERRLLRTHTNNFGTARWFLTYVYFYSPKTRSVVKYHFQVEGQQRSGGDLTLEHTVDIELIQRGNTPKPATVVAVKAPAPELPNPDEIEMKHLAPRPEAYKTADSATQMQNVPAAPITLRMNLIGQRKESDGTYTEILVKEGSALRSRDNFQVHFETSSPAFIYILLYDSEGKASQLFPNPKIDQSNFVEGGRSIVIPERDSWFWLDESPGTETVYVIAAKNSMSDIKGLLAKMESTDDAGQKNASQQIRQSIAVMQRGVGGVTKGQTVTYSLSDGKKIQNVTDVVEGTGSVVRAVSFQHR